MKLPNYKEAEFMQKSSFEQNGGTYRRVGDFKIPNLTLPPEEANIRLGKWGMLHNDYLIKKESSFCNPAF